MRESEEGQGQRRGVVPGWVSSPRSISSRGHCVRLDHDPVVVRHVRITFGPRVWQVYAGAAVAALCTPQVHRWVCGGHHQRRAHVYLFWCTSMPHRGVRTYGISWSVIWITRTGHFGTDRVAGANRHRMGGSLDWLPRSEMAPGLLPGASGLSAQYLGADSIAKGKLGTDALPIHNDVPGMRGWLLTLGSGMWLAWLRAWSLGGVDDNLSRYPSSRRLASGRSSGRVGRIASVWQRWLPPRALPGTMLGHRKLGEDLNIPPKSPQKENKNTIAMSFDLRPESLFGPQDARRPNSGIGR